MIPTLPFGNTIFCDDIRDEVGGKNSFMGVYAGDIRLPEVPGNLAKFGFGVRYFHAVDDAREPVILRIFVPGKEGDILALEAALPVAEARKGATAPSFRDDDAETPLLALMANVVMSPFQVQATGRIKVRAYVGPEEEEIRLGTLAVELAPTVLPRPDDDAS